MNCPVCGESSQFRSPLASDILDGKPVGELTEEEVTHLFLHEWAVDGSALDGLYFVQQAIGTDSELFRTLEQFAIENDTRIDPTPPPFFLK